MLAMFDVFGPNISTASGVDWQRQRKVTGAQFNEQSSSTVWIQALTQASEVLEYWKSLPTPICRTHKDTRTLSLHVLSGAGFGKPYSFTKAAESPKEGHMFNYRDSLALILENALMILVFGPKFLGRKWLPKRFSRLGQACVDFRDHMEMMVREEKKVIHQGKSGSRNLINSLVMASDEMIELTGDKSVRGRGLTQDELETLRLLNPLIGIAKSTGAEPQPLTLNGKTIFIPSNTRVIPNINVMHSHPKYWGSDALVWRPNRWVLSKNIDSETQIQGENLPNKSINPKSIPEEEFLFSPQRGTCVPWSEGARACPGKKFGQVEFVATMVSLFRGHRMKVVPEKGERVEEARKRAEKSVWDSEIVLLLQMKKPELVGVKWVEIE
ncbi:hypothetical protein BPAE_0071g00280 [Botrytis paeoniae]|uniref:Cytochrome P450 n=1 Tax=Botrytis paeoniae TaxID=278948 RepID=A0A4Z1FVT8_9HELO|nr:hypothetical protein BPAE_0071g00280 [Botrytis paeoniae]